MLSELPPTKLLAAVEAKVGKPQPVHVTFFVIEMLDAIARRRAAPASAGTRASSPSQAVQTSAAVGVTSAAAAVDVNADDNDAADSLRLRERAIELLGEVYKGETPLFPVADDRSDTRAHILKRLRRLCTIPDDTRLADVAKQTLKEAFAFKGAVSRWHCAAVACRGGASTTPSIAEGLHSKTGVSSVVTIDSMLPQPRFYDLYDVGTGPLYGNAVPGSGTTSVIESACREVRKNTT